MSRSFPVVIVMILAASVVGAPASAATVGFESASVGTVWGAPSGDMPGDVVFTEDNIPMSVENFVLGSFTGFNNATVDGASTKFPTHSLLVNNISLDFDFSGLSFAVNAVTFDFANSGGADNLSVNGGTIYEGPLGSAPTNIASGVTLTFFDDGDMSFVQSGTIQLVGDMDSIRIGGQELEIDNIVATPEPAALTLIGLGGLTLAARRRNR